MIDLEDVLGLEPMKEGGKRTIVVIRSTSGTPFALGVQAVDNHEELVIRPASPLIMASGLYAGMTLPDNGQPMLLLDASGLAKAAMLPLMAEEIDEQEHGGRKQEEAIELDRKSTRLNSITNAPLVCRLLLENKKTIAIYLINSHYTTKHIHYN